jgi:DNA end-binding protein Ku
VAGRSRGGGEGTQRHPEGYETLRRQLEEVVVARSIWTGSISFGLVNVPVKVYSAVKQKDVHFSQFDKNGNKIKYKRVSEKTGREVDYEDIVKGYERSKGHFVMIDPEELEKFAPQATRTIDIEDFVNLEEIDPVYYEHTYYLAPDGKAASHAYALLHKAMSRQGKVAIGRVVMRTKQYLAAIRPYGKALALSTLLFADEVVPVDDNPEIPDRLASVPEREQKMAEQIIESLTTKWNPKRYKDTYRETVLDYIGKKDKGEEVVIDLTEEPAAKVTDLMAALEASLKANKGRSRQKRKVSA